jgi:DNA-binding transcriptional LysR family regulator
MDASDLRFFEAVARLGSMSLAGAELNTVQSNVTARIRALEDEIGTPLFERHNRGVSLTAAGRRLLPYSASVSRLLEDARRAATDDGVPKGMLTVGSLETTAALRLSPILTEYASRYPNVDLVLRTGTSCELVEQVLEHKLEGAFVCGPVDHPDLHEEAVFEEELVTLRSRASTVCSRAMTSRSSCCEQDALTGNAWKRCLQPVASSVSGSWSSARWSRSSIASVPASV